MEPGTPRCPVRVTEQLYLSAGGDAVEGGKAAAIGKNEPAGIGADFGGEEFVEDGTGVGHAADRVAIGTARGIPEQQLGVVIDALAVHRRDHAGERGRRKASHFDGASRSFSQLDTAVDFYSTRDERVPECTSGETRRVLDDVDVPTRTRPRSDRP